MKMNLYIITHKKIDTKHFIDRKIMLVGAKGKEAIGGYCLDYDETKDNISAKNKNYCELTGLYYMVQNDDSDIFGLEHYRRIFVKRRFYLFKYPIYKKKDIEKIMKDYDIILPNKCKFEDSIYNEYAKAHYEEDLIKVREIISKDYVDYLKSFDEIMNSKETYLLNMFIGKTSVIKDYAKWLFDILFKLESKIDLSDRDDYQKRVFGFLSERLFSVYISRNKNIKVYHSHVQMIFENPFSDELHRVGNRFKKLFNKNKEK